MFEKIRSELSLWKEMFGASMVAFSFKKWEEEIDAAEKEIEKLKTEAVDAKNRNFENQYFEEKRKVEELRKELAEAKYKRRVQCFRVDFGADDFKVTAL